MTPNQLNTDTHSERIWRICAFVGHDGFYKHVNASMIGGRGQCASLARTLLALIGVLVLFGGGEGTPSPTAAYKFEEYVVEHEVSALRAKNAALAIDLDAIQPPFSCQKCTTEEIRYCESANFVSDHCCCDRRFHELPYIPHTCYLGRKLCRPIAGHCDEYTKIRKCCCDKHALALWKAKSSSNSIIFPHRRKTLVLHVLHVIISVFAIAAFHQAV